MRRVDWSSQVDWADIFLESILVPSRLGRYVLVSLQVFCFEAVHGMKVHRTFEFVSVQCMLIVLCLS